MNVTFDETPPVVTSYLPTRGFTGFLLRHRIVQTIAQAQKILLIIALCTFIAAGGILRYAFRSSDVDSGKNLVPALSHR